jgi:hypothetical protein
VQNAAFPSVKGNGTHLTTTDLFLLRLTLNAAAIPVRSATMLARNSVGPGLTAHVRCVVITEAIQWCEQIQHCLNWLPIQQHVSTGTQIYTHV